MKDFVIFVDSACDIPPETLKEWGVRFCSLSLVFSDDPKEYSDYDIPAKEFYGKMRNGVQAKTYCICAFLQVFPQHIILQAKLQPRLCKSTKAAL